MVRMKQKRDITIQTMRLAVRLLQERDLEISLEKVKKIINSKHAPRGVSEKFRNFRL